MDTIGFKVLCKYLNNLTLFQFLERTIRDSHRINMKNDEGPTQCLPERAQIPTANFKKLLIIKSKHLQGTLLDCFMLLRGNSPGALLCFSLSLQLNRAPSPLASQESSAFLSLPPSLAPSVPPSLSGASRYNDEKNWLHVRETPAAVPASNYLLWDFRPLTLRPLNFLTCTTGFITAALTLGGELNKMMPRGSGQGIQLLLWLLGSLRLL